MAFDPRMGAEGHPRGQWDIEIMETKEPKGLSDRRRRPHKAVLLIDVRVKSSQHESNVRLHRTSDDLVQLERRLRFLFPKVLEELGAPSRITAGPALQKKRSLPALMFGSGKSSTKEESLDYTKASDFFSLASRDERLRCDSVWASFFTCILGDIIDKHGNMCTEDPNKTISKLKTTNLLLQEPGFADRLAQTKKEAIERQDVHRELETSAEPTTSLNLKSMFKKDSKPSSWTRKETPQAEPKKPHKSRSLGRLRSPTESQAPPLPTTWKDDILKTTGGPVPEQQAAVSSSDSQPPKDIKKKQSLKQLISKSKPQSRSGVLNDKRRDTEPAVQKSSEARVPELPKPTLSSPEPKANEDSRLDAGSTFTPLPEIPNISPRLSFSLNFDNFGFSDNMDRLNDELGRTELSKAHNQEVTVSKNACESRTPSTAPSLPISSQGTQEASNTSEVPLQTAVSAKLSSKMDRKSKGAKQAKDASDKKAKAIVREQERSQNKDPQDTKRVSKNPFHPLKDITNMASERALSPSKSSKVSTAKQSKHKATRDSASSLLQRGVETDFDMDHVPQTPIMSGKEENRPVIPQLLLTSATPPSSERGSFKTSFSSPSNRVSVLHDISTDDDSESLIQVPERSKSPVSKTAPGSSSKLDEFIPLKVIGKGYSGKVLVVKHKPSSEVYALKIIQRRNIRRNADAIHTRAEQVALRRCALKNTPFIVRLHQSFRTPEHLCLLLDFHMGGDLATQLGRFNRLHRDWARFFATEIVEGLTALHSLGIIYRDLKPENVLISSAGHIVLADFGLCKVFDLKKTATTKDSEFKTSSFVGTAEYLAPEILLGEAYGHSVDTWAFGTILFEMLLGITPFWAEDQTEMYHRIIQDPLVLSGLPVSLGSETKSLLQGLLAKKPRDRLSDEAIKAHPYFQNIDWGHVANQRYEPPFQPKTNGNGKFDVQNFDAAYTRLPVTYFDSDKEDADDLVDDPVMDDHFRDFSFDNTI